MSGGCTGNRSACKLQIGQSTKLNRREIALHGTRTANTLCQGPVAAETQVAGWQIPPRESLTFLPPDPNGGGPERLSLWDEVKRAESGDTSGASMGLGQFNPVAGVGFKADHRDFVLCNKMSRCDLLGADTVSEGMPFCPLQEVVRTDWVG